VSGDPSRLVQGVRGLETLNDGNADGSGANPGYAYGNHPAEFVRSLLRP
jgi:hypothetical protein